MKEFKKDEAMSFKGALILFLEKIWILQHTIQKKMLGVCRSYKIKDGSYMYTYTSDDNLKMYFTKGLEWM